MAEFDFFISTVIEFVRGNENWIGKVNEIKNEMSPKLRMSSPQLFL